MDITNFSLGTLFGVLITQLIQHMLVKSRDSQKALSEISKNFLEEMNAIVSEMNTVRTLNSPLEAIGFMHRMELGSVKFTAFKKTCTRRQRKDLDAAYNDYKNNNDKYQSIIHLKSLVENIINHRAV